MKAHCGEIRRHRRLAPDAALSHHGVWNCCATRASPPAEYRSRCSPVKSASSPPPTQPYTRTCAGRPLEAEPDSESGPGERYRADRADGCNSRDCRDGADKLEDRRPPRGALLALTTAPITNATGTAAKTASSTWPAGAGGRVGAGVSGPRPTRR